MIQSETQLDAQVTLPTPEVPRAGHGELDALFAEVNALQIRLKQVARGFHAEGDSEVGGQDVLQILLQSDGQTVPQIARIRGTSRQNIQTVVNRLKARGSIELIKNPAHKKSDLVHLTARGRALLAMTVAEQEKFMAGLLPHFSENEIGDAVRLLRRFRELLSARPTRTRPAVAQRTPLADNPIDDYELPVNLL